MMTVATRIDDPTNGRLNEAASKLGLKISDLLRVGLCRLLDEVDRDGKLTLPLESTQTPAFGSPRRRRARA